jgi:hypothetical protein
MRLGKVVKSNSHCDYLVQVDDQMEVFEPPSPDDYGFGSFIKLEEPTERHWAVGLVYNSQLINPMFLSTGPRLSSEPDPMFTPDLINETRTLLNVVLIGSIVYTEERAYGVQGIPRVVVPVNTPAFLMTQPEIYQFHLNLEKRPQLVYYSHLLRSGGAFASQLAQQVLQDLVKQQQFGHSEQRAIEMLCKELAWKNTVTVMR